MGKLEQLKAIKTKPELAELLGVKPSFLTNVLYRHKPKDQYYTFYIKKRNGGLREINAPQDKLKSLQRSLSNLLLDCIDEINKDKFPPIVLKKKRTNNLGLNNFEILKIKIPSTEIKQPSLSHGFVRRRSIVTNAMMHINQKNVLNIDLENFFDCFNFGRVRGFFIKNSNFKLDAHIATVIAHIACCDSKLPQGGPSSPVITNLITHPLDIRLASLAKKNSCIYTRYADDITFSTRRSVFPEQIMRWENKQYIAGKKLKSEIVRSGFSINENKTRIQFKDSRQDVTGLIVNEKPNVKKEYWRTAKAQCHRLFSTGSFTTTCIQTGAPIEGNLNKLEGQLNFIDQLDRYNRLRQKPPLNHNYMFAKHGSNTFVLLSGRERTFSRFLYFRLFYGNHTPTILCEGQTDNIYLKSAINMLAASYPSLATKVVDPKTKKIVYELLVRFMKYTKRSRFLLELFGGTSYLSSFIRKFDSHYKFYDAPKPQHPVIIILDNDSGFKSIESALKKISSTTPFSHPGKENTFKNADFIHVTHNLYVVLTPLSDEGADTAIEDLFDSETKSTKVASKTFNPDDKTRDPHKEYGKEIFAKKVIKANKKSINFNGLKPLLDRVVMAIEHYDAIKES